MLCAKVARFVVSVTSLLFFTRLVSAQVTQQLSGQLTANLSVADIASLPANVVSAALSQGWTQSPTGFQYTFPLANAEVTNGTVTILTDSNGNFTPAIGQNGPWSVVASDGTYVLTNVGNTWIISNDISIMDNEFNSPPPPPASPSPLAAAPLPLCNDQNGGLGDGIRYGGGWRRYRNFIGSDCFRAIALGDDCLLDNHFGNPGCAARHGGNNCSGYTPPILPGGPIPIWGFPDPSINFATLTPTQSPIVALSPAAYIQDPYTSMLMNLGQDSNSGSVLTGCGSLATTAQQGCCCCCSLRSKKSVQTGRRYSKAASCCKAHLGA